MLESWSHRIDLLVLKCKNYIDNIKLQVHVVMNTRICCSRVLVNAVGIFISLVDSRVSGEGLKEVLLKTKVSRMVWYQTLVSGPITQLKYYSGQVTPQSCITIKQVHYFHLLNTHCCYQATQKLAGNREDQQLHGFQQNEDGRLGRIANTLNIFTNISNSECQPHNEYLSIS